MKRFLPLCLSVLLLLCGCAAPPGKADPALSMEKPAVLFYSPMACSVSLHPIYYDETVAVRAAMQKYRTSSGDAGEKAGGSAMVTINGIQITGAYTDSDDGRDTYQAAGAQFTLTADGGITRFSASGDEYNARTETVSTEEALQLCRDFLAEHCPFATDFEEDLSSRTQYDPENGDDEYRFSFARTRGSIETASVFIEMDGCGNIRYVYASAPELWQIEALPDDASIISATEEKLRAHYAQRPKLGVAEVTGTALSQANVTFCPGEYGLDFGIITYIMYYTLTYEDGRTDTAAYSFWYLFE